MNTIAASEKNKKRIIALAIELIGYVILIGVLRYSIILGICMAIIMSITNITLSVNDNKMKYIISIFIMLLISTLTLIGIFYLDLDLSIYISIIVLESVIQIILNIIEIVNISPFFKRNIKKIIAGLLFIIAFIVIIISSIKIYKLKKFEKEIEKAKELGKYIEINNYYDMSDEYQRRQYRDYIIKLDDEMSINIRGHQDFMPGAEMKYPVLYISTYVGEIRDNYELFKHKYKILKVKVNGKDKEIDEQSIGFPLSMGSFKKNSDGDKVEIYIRNEQTQEIIRIYVPIHIEKTC